VKVPAGVSDEVAAAAMLKGLTARYLLKATYPVKAGETILFHSAAGGVGLIACQWAKHLGVTVIGTVGSDDKIALAKANGCDHVLNVRKEDWVKRVRELTGGTGVPVVYDSIGKDTFLGSLDCLAIRGMLVYFGNSSGAAAPFEPLLLSQKGSLYLTRPTLASYARNAEELRETSPRVR
jgi:NADPH2:quinone reductase